MTTTRPSIPEVVDRFLREAPPPNPQRPRCIIVLGRPAVGKSRLRHSQYRHEGVQVDAGDLFVALAPEEVLSFPHALASTLEEAGNALARRALAGRRSIVTEVIGDDKEAVEALVDAIAELGYEVQLDLVEASVETAQRYNMSRGENNISAYHAEEFNIRWLLNAAWELAPDGD